jgi:hypothetical protein
MGEGRELPYPDIDIRVVRRYANGRANTSSVRAIAAEIGVGHTSFDKFLAGSEPFAKNRKLLCEWYLHTHRVHPVQTELEVLTDAVREDPVGLVDALLSDLRGEARTEAHMRITSALAQGYRRMGQAEPEWLWAK